MCVYYYNAPDTYNRYIVLKKLLCLPTAPARVASFGEHVNTIVGSKCTIECYKVGMPTPVIVWKTPDGIETK
jgi:hypothetical protein